MNGYVAGFQAAGHDIYRAATETFFRLVTSAHSYVTGGSNDREFWGPPNTIADAVTNVRLSLLSQCAIVQLVLQGHRLHLSSRLSVTSSHDHESWGAPNTLAEAVTNVRLPLVVSVCCCPIHICLLGSTRTSPASMKQNEYDRFT